jgi:ribosomal-protein-alanine N-acetyltransferase
MPASEHWTVERLDPDRDLDAVAIVDDESFVKPWTRAMYVADLARADVSFIHVLRGPASGLVGVCSAWIVGDELHINNIAIRPAWRGRGLGRALVTAVLRNAAGRGVRRATLEVRRSNTVAQQLYHSLGFRHAGTRPNYYERPMEDALILWKDEVESVGGV